MAAKTTIEWTEMTWNPVTGCSKISSGCKNCYAERMAKRLQGMGVPQYANGFKVQLAPHVLNNPFKWANSRFVFVNSMSDLFHEEVPVEYIQRVFEVMSATPQHTYQILTKRHERMSKIAPVLPWPSNVWMGVSVEDQKATNRIAALVGTPACVKFISIEPLIGPIDDLRLDGIDWVIVGGESGPGARRMEKAWIEAIFAKCLSDGVAFFFKQWGKREFNVNQDDPTIAKTHPRHAKGGCELNGIIYQQLPAR
jgi:protein gp37